MRQFVDWNFVPLVLLKVGLLRVGPQEGVPEYDDSDILHAIYSELWHVDLVKLLERKWARKEFLEEHDGLFEMLESLFGIRVFCFVLPAVEIHRHVEVGVFVWEALVGASSQGVNVCADGRGWFEKDNSPSVRDGQVLNKQVQVFLGDNGRGNLGLQTDSLLDVVIRNESPFFIRCDHC